MPVPTLITELSTTAVSNYPSGSDSPATLDDVQRAHASFIAQIRDGTVAIAGTGLTGTASALSIGGNAATATNATNVTGTIASGVTATTQTAGDNSTKVATTAYVATALSVIPVATVQTFALASAPTGWLKANGGTIGNAASGGTLRANADTSTLFTALWTDFPNTVLAIQDSTGAASTRGASAAADFAANKRLPVHDLRGEFIRGFDDGRGIDTGRVLGSGQLDEFKAHTHGIGSYQSVDATGGSYPSNISSSTYILSSSTGGTETRPRNIALLVCIKY